MRIDEKFNARSAQLVECTAQVQQSGSYSLGVRVTFLPNAPGDHRKMALHLSPNECLALAADLLNAARKRRLDQ